MGRLIRLLILCIPFVLWFSQAGASTYVDNNDGTITDSAESLVWQKQDDGVERTWDDAVSYCEELQLGGYDDWALPKVHMLEGLIDTSFSPTINSLFNVKPSYYWSASESLNSVNSAKYVNFFYGNTYAFSKDNTYYTICVREEISAILEPLSVDVKVQVNSDSAPFEVEFTADISGGAEPYFFEWDFSDGEFSSSSSPVHLFTKAGSYTVVLTATDNDGDIAFATSDVVLPPEKKIEETSAVKEDSDVDGFNDGKSIATPSVPEEKLEGQEISPAKSEKEHPGAGGEETVSEIPPPSGGEKSAEVQSVGEESVGEDIAVAPEQKDIRSSTDSLEVSGNASLIEMHALSDNETLVSVTDSGTYDTGKNSEESPSKSIFPLELKKEVEAGEEKRKEMRIIASKKGVPVQVVTSGEGLLAYSFANGLYGDADWNKDNKVTARELKSYIGMAIDNLSSGHQKADVSMSSGDFPICSDSGVTHVMTVAVDIHDAGNSGRNFSAISAKSMAKVLTQKCTSWRQLTLTGNDSDRNNIFNGLAQMIAKVGPEDNFILYYAGDFIKHKDDLLLMTNDTVPALSSYTAILYSDLQKILGDMVVKHLITLIEVTPYKN